MTEHPSDEHSETWFGTGLRAHLGIGSVEPTEPSAPAEQAPAAADVDLRRHELLAMSAELDERARRLREAERRLGEREETVSARDAELARKAERLEVTRAEIAARDSRAAGADDLRGPVREMLRTRAEREAERLWRTIEQALDAVLEDGRPDYHARLAAVKLLLGEAYDPGATMDALPLPADQPTDELARRRAERGP
jgi:hypothetical protein